MFMRAKETLIITPQMPVTHLLSEDLVSASQPSRHRDTGLLVGSRPLQGNCSTVTSKSSKASGCRGAGCIMVRVRKGRRGGDL